MPEDKKLSALVNSRAILQPWGGSSLQIKSTLEAAYWIVKQVRRVVNTYIFVYIDNSLFVRHLVMLKMYTGQS